MVAGVMLFIPSSCGQIKDLDDSQADIRNSTAGACDGADKVQETQNDSIVNSVHTNLSEEPEEERQSIPDEVDLCESEDLDFDANEPLDFQNKGNKDSQIKREDSLEILAGEYEYQSDYGTGKLIINKTSYGYEISDYESESSYRFLADSSNIETIENNRIYIKYPEQVFSDDTAIFCYYILEYSTDKINVYYAKSADEEGQFLYHAIRRSEEGQAVD